MKIWWQVYYFDYKTDSIKCFGFSSVNGIITDHPNYEWKADTLENYKTFLRTLPYLQVFKIC